MAKSGRVVGNPANYRNPETERRYAVKGSGIKRGPYNKNKMIKEIKVVDDVNGEVWRCVDEYEWCEVSSMGRIKSRGSIQEFPDGAINSGRFMVHDIDNVGVWIRIRLWKEVLKIKYPTLNPAKVEFLDNDNTNCSLSNLYISDTYINHLSKYQGTYTKGKSSKLADQYHANKTTIPKTIEVPIHLDYMDCISEEETAEIKILRTEFIKLVEFNNDILEKHKQEITNLKNENYELRRKIAFLKTR